MCILVSGYIPGFCGLSLQNTVLVAEYRAAGFSWLAGLLQTGELTPEQLGLRSGLLLGALFPLGTWILLLWQRHIGKLQQIGEQK